VATAGQVLTMLCADKEWSVIGNDYEDINWYGQEPFISKKQFEDGFNAYDAWEAAASAKAAAAKAALLEKLGITEEEAKLLLS
jgi:hypothetical protein